MTLQQRKNILRFKTDDTMGGKKLYVPKRLCQAREMEKKTHKDEAARHLKLQNRKDEVSKVHDKTQNAL